MTDEHRTALKFMSHPSRTSPVVNCGNPRDSSSRPLSICTRKDIAPLLKVAATVRLVHAPLCTTS